MCCLKIQSDLFSLFGLFLSLGPKTCFFVWFFVVVCVFLSVFDGKGVSEPPQTDTKIVPDKICDNFGPYNSKFHQAVFELGRRTCFYEVKWHNVGL